MNDFISRESALSAQNKSMNLNEMRERLKRIPAADVRPVVLCRDCKHRDPEDHKCDSGGAERQGCPFEVADDYFCAYGEKMEES